jgi:hypothetical protein
MADGAVTVYDASTVITGHAMWKKQWKNCSNTFCTAITEALAEDSSLGPPKGRMDHDDIRDLVIRVKPYLGFEIAKAGAEYRDSPGHDVAPPHVYAYKWMDELTPDWFDIDMDDLPDQFMNLTEYELQDYVIKDWERKVCVAALKKNMVLPVLFAYQIIDESTLDFAIADIESRNSVHKGIYARNEQLSASRPEYAIQRDITSENVDPEEARDKERTAEILHRYCPETDRHAVDLDDHVYLSGWTRTGVKLEEKLQDIVQSEQAEEDENGANDNETRSVEVQGQLYTAKYVSILFRFCTDFVCL